MEGPREGRTFSLDVSKGSFDLQKHIHNPYKRKIKSIKMGRGKTWKETETKESGHSLPVEDSEGN